MLSSNTLQYLLQNINFETVLDVGSGSGKHAKIFLDNNKYVTCVDNGNSIYFNKNINVNSDKLKLYISNFDNFETNEQYDLVWCSHILEHQKNVGLFLSKCYSLTKDGGIICITVPPMKTNIVGGHLTLWNSGLLLYNLVINGIDCSNATVLSYGYNISVIVKKQKPINIALLNLSYDYGDIEKLRSFFPIPVYQNFNGNIDFINKQGTI